jgi:hypothetical protein
LIPINKFRYKMVPYGELKFALHAETTVDFANVVSVSFATGHDYVGQGEPAENRCRHELYTMVSNVLPDKHWVLTCDTDRDCKIYCLKVHPRTVPDRSNPHNINTDLCHSTGKGCQSL